MRHAFQFSEEDLGDFGRASGRFGLHDGLRVGLHDGLRLICVSVCVT
jgi:hypothetical protein